MNSLTTVVTGLGLIAAAQSQAMGGMGATDCITPPCLASPLGAVGYTTVAGGDHAVGTNVFGPFEAGFTSTQDNVLAGFGCDTGEGYIIGGVDTRTAEQVVAADCEVTLPRMDGNRYIGLLNECGFHAGHFHQFFLCLWQGQATDHSIQIADVEGMDDQFIYGKFENEAAQELPELDACGGHFGVTPESNGEVVYHYHVQDAPPFTVGCIGPAADGGMMKLSECRALHAECGDGDNVFLTVPAGQVEYDPWCPCYDGEGSNVGNVPLAFEQSDDTTAAPTTSEPTTSEPTTSEPTTSEPTTSEPTTSEPTTSEPTTSEPTTSEPTTSEPTTSAPPPTPTPTPSPTPSPTRRNMGGMGMGHRERQFTIRGREVN